MTSPWQECNEPNKFRNNGPGGVYRGLCTELTSNTIVFFIHEAISLRIRESSETHHKKKMIIPLGTIFKKNIALPVSSLAFVFSTYCSAPFVELSRSSCSAHCLNFLLVSFVPFLASVKKVQRDEGVSSVFIPRASP